MLPRGLILAVLYLFVIQKNILGATVRVTALDRATAARVGSNFNKVIFFAGRVKCAQGIAVADRDYALETGAALKK